MNSNSHPRARAISEGRVVQFAATTMENKPVRSRSLNANKESLSSQQLVIVSESTDFLLPENQLSVDISQRQYQANITSMNFAVNPPYLNSYFDEYSRSFITIQVGKHLRSNVPLVKYDCNIATNDQTILQLYNPGFNNWYSTFKTSPNDSQYLLNGRVYSDFNLLFRMNNFTLTRQKPFEPLFLSLCLYTILDEKILRVCETFNFDCTEDLIRKKYPELYKPNSSNRSVNVGDANGVEGYINKVKATIPEDLRNKDLFVVCQLSKILTSTGDSAVSPYKSSPSLPPELSKHVGLCNRLVKFRQPIGLGIVRINDDNGNLEREVLNISVPLFSQKSCLSDELIFQARNYFASRNCLYCFCFCSIFENCFRWMEQLHTVELVIHLK